ncbi:hypothetical protein DQ384_31495 [Sphaerisporangium album]|uniref:Uncharacterized protein n=1 Tax=Sphaerisporangium album TaxID=509200 RepID=A0A367F6A3_9ACTN|nr:lantibiotic dehydratase [Sphaerisporangium album]RCG25392.1 hypothetical protein DQ384_31495 [Sphaerisporangium album]
MSWLLHDQLVVRTTGFPYEVLEEIRLPRTAADIDAVLAAERAAEAHRDRLLREVFPEAVRAARDASGDGDPATGRLLSKQRAAVGRRVPAPRPEAAPDPALVGLLQDWNRLLAEAAELAAGASAEHPAELELCRKRLGERAKDPVLRDAVLLLSPAFHEGLRRYAESPDGRGGRESRQIERRLVTYLQRLAAKNETNSHFGPVNYGTLDPDLPAAVRIERDPSVVTRTVFASARLAEAVSDGVRADPRMRAHLRPRPSVAHRFTDGRAVSALTGKPVALDATDARLIALSETGLTVRELARELADTVTPEDDGQAVAGRVDALVRRRLLAYAPLAAPDTARPLDAVAAWLDALPDPDDAVRVWRATTAELTALVEACGAGSRADGVTATKLLEERYEALTGEAARRGAGRMYVDRTLVFEECRGDLTRFELGGPVAARVGDGLVPVLDLWRTAALLRRHDQQVRARTVLDAVAAEASVPLLTYLRASAEHRPAAQTSADEGTALARFEGLVRGLLEGRESEARVDLRGEEVAALAARARTEFVDVAVPGADSPAFTSVDLLIAARDEHAPAEGDFQIVVGEGHAPALLSVFPTDHFRREEGRPDRIAALMDNVFADAGVRVAQVVIGRGTKIFPYRVADILVELRPHLPRAGEAVPAAALRVLRDGAGVALHDDDGPLLLHPQLKRAPGFDPLAAFTLPAVEDHPFLLPGHTPRLTVDGVVYQRERWQEPGLPWDASLSGWPLLRAAREWRHRAGMPEQVYYRTPEEPKPLLLDFTSRHLIEVFHRHVARSTGPVTVTEMLPSPDGIWLPAPDGRHTFELRAFAIHPGEKATTPSGPGWRIDRGHAPR